MKLIVLISGFFLLVGCGGSNGTSPAVAPAGAVTYRSLLRQADITTQFKHIIFFNTTTLTNYLGRPTVDKGTVLGQAFVNDDVLAVPIPYGDTDVIIADPVDPVQSTVVVQNGSYLLTTTATGITTGPYLSAITRTNTNAYIGYITFDMLTGNINSVSSPASVMYLNMLDNGAILAPAGGVYDGYGINSGHWKVDTITGNFIPA